MTMLWHQLINIAANSPHPIEQGLLAFLALAVPAGLAAVLLQTLKHKYVHELDGAERIFISIRKRVISFDWAAFAQITLAVLSLLMSWAGDYLVRSPYNGEAFFGVAGLLFMLATLLHRFAVNRSYRILIDFLSYLRDKKPATV